MHKFIKRTACAFVTFALLFGTAVPSAMASSEDPVYTGDTLVAVNTDFSANSQTYGSFTVQSDLAAQQSLRSAGGSQNNVYKTYRDPDSGERLSIVTPDLPELSPAADDMTAEFTLPDAMRSEHAADDTFRLISQDKSRVDMTCLYVGTYCTVWGATSDDAAVCLTSQQAQEIGEQFDVFFPDVTNAFGSYWYDADEDGRVAIMCYDIGRNYGTSVSTYTAGYFYSVDMLGLDGRLNGIRFGNTPTNAMDCIHIDTYPLMGYSTPMSDIEACFDTLVHEFQHMLNFSSLIRNGQRMYPTMPTYLNEAFSMAAEHLICGAGSNTDRITYFNGSKYIQGTALTYWGSTLSNYANSYLFSQYIRTRYGALNADDGSTLFHAVLDARQTDPYADCLSLIADLLNTTEQALITDFWCACYLKEDSGNWGFQGERWADSISPHVAADFSSTYGIYNGGAKFYDLTNGFTPLSSSNVTFAALTDPIVEIPAEAPVLTELTAERLSLSEGKIAFTADRNGRLFYTLTSGEITDKSQLSHEIELTANTHTTLWVDTLYAPDQAPTFYYFTEADGVQSDLQSIQIPPLDCYVSIFAPNEAELFVHSAAKGTAYLALYEAQTGQMLELHAGSLNGADLYLPIYTAHDLTACTVKVFLLDENGTPMRAAYQP